MPATIKILFSFLLAFFISLASLHAQPQAHPGMREGQYNYQSFSDTWISSIRPQFDRELLNANEGYESDPELGMKFKETPCKDCYEAIGKRTETTKTYIKRGTQGKTIYSQSSTAPMHYRDANNKWRTIKTWLTPENGSKGIYTATEQEVPVSIDAARGIATIGKGNNKISFNNQLELLFEHSDGSVTSLGGANWDKYTAGNDGLYVTDAWPGIDIEMHVIRGAVKTNFWINRPMPAYASGQLLVRDHLKLDKGLTLFAGGKTRYTGVLEVRNTNGEKEYIISTATAFEKKDLEAKTLRNLEYRIGSDNTLDIAVPGDFLNRPAHAYPVIIDPLVSAPTTVTVPGSTYSAGWTTGCAIYNPATVPPDLTISDVQFTFEYEATGGAVMAQGAMDFRLGSCRSPDLSGWYWYCLVYTAGTCGGTDISIYSHVSSCVPAVRCASYDLGVTMNFYQNYTSLPPCTNMYIIATMPLTITVVGNTLDAAATTSAATICAGNSATLTGSATYGKTPYTYSWSPGGMTSASVSVSPAVTTIYTLIVTDSCGTRDTVTTTVNVNPAPPITGTTNICVGLTSSLSNAVTGGTWSSSNTAVATVNAATGLVGGVSMGTCNITYTTPAGCIITVAVTVYPTPVITSATKTDPVNCITLDGTITLNGLTAGMSYTINLLYNGLPVTFTGTADASGRIILTSLNGGTYANIVVVSAIGCTSNMFSGPLILNLPPSPATPTATNNSPICAGDLLTFTSSTTSTGVNYQWSGPSGFSSLAQNPFIASAGAGNAGVYTVVVTDPATGCQSAPTATLVVVNPVPFISNAVGTNPTVCFGTDGQIALTGLLPAVSYSVSYTFNGTPLTATIVADGSGQVIITGLSAGLYSAMSVSSFGCLSNTAPNVILVDPGAPPVPEVWSNSPICAGTNLHLFATDSMPGVSYYWQGPGGFTSSLQHPVVPNVMTAGTYTVTVSRAGCETKGFTSIAVYPGLTLVNVTPDKTIDLGETVQLSAGGALYYLWTPDDGTLNDPTINNPVARPTHTTTYIVTGMNNWGCRDSAQVVIDVRYPDTVFIPSSFTPNGDGLNDIFRIVNTRDYKLVDFSVFNRWGQPVYHDSYNIRKGWDGSFNGQSADLGVYYYHIIISRPDGENRTFKGEVTLIR